MVQLLQLHICELCIVEVNKISFIVYSKLIIDTHISQKYQSIILLLCLHKLTHISQKYQSITLLLCLYKLLQISL